MGENVRYLMHKYDIVNSDWSQNINILYSSGVSRISFRGGVQKFSGKVGVFAWRSHAFARGVRGHAPPRKFLKMVQFGAF